jgi:hypothetical protein
MADYFDVDPAATQLCICACCGWDVESEQGCQCPECPTCGEQGNPRCYESSQDPDGSSNPDGHNMDYNDIQQYGVRKRQEMDAAERKQAEEQMEEEERARKLLEEFGSPFSPAAVSGDKQEPKNS